MKGTGSSNSYFATFTNLHLGTVIYGRLKKKKGVNLEV